MNNKPVAWMQTWENQDGELKQTVNIQQIGKQDIPLYTHPVKELPNNHQYIAQLEMTVRNQQAEIEALKVDLKKYDELAIDDLNGKRTVWCGCGDSITPDSGALCGNCVSARPSQTLLTMTFEEMYPILDFARAILKKAQEK